MKIGLVRHFKVDSPKYKQPIDSAEFTESQRIYHKCEVIKKPVNLNGIEWQFCICSILPRAKITAGEIYKGIIKYSPTFVEVEVYPFIDTEKKFSFTTWYVLGRIAWWFNHKSQLESRKKTLIRCRNAYKEIIESDSQNVLIVSHGFFIHELGKLLKKEGFRGNIDYAPRNAELYLFTRN